MCVPSECISAMNILEGYTLEKLKIYYQKFYGQYNDLLYTPDLTSPDMAGYTLDFMTGA